MRKIYKSGVASNLGYTLVELLFALALIGIILSGVMSLMLRSTAAGSQVQVRSELTNETQLAQNYMVAKLRGAAFVFPPSGVPSIPSTIQWNNSGYEAYNPFNGTGNYTWRIGVDPIVAFVVPPKTVTDGGCVGANSATRSEFCYAFYAFYAIPRSQITRGVTTKSIAAAKGPNFIGVNSANDDSTWVIMEYRSYYTAQGFIKSTGSIPTGGNSMVLLDFVRPPATGETLFSLPASPTNPVTLNLAASQKVGTQTISVPNGSRYSVNVYPRNLYSVLAN